MYKILNAKIRNFIFLRESGEVITNTFRLSDMYTSRSAKYASCLNQSPFIIITDKSQIVSRGYSKLCKAIITVDAEHPLVLEVVGELKSELAKRVEYDIMKNQQVEDIKKEALTIIIDEDFKTALAWAAEATGNEKSDRMASAMKGLLSRNNIAEIKTDFWKVFRILKSKAETS